MAHQERVNDPDWPVLQAKARERVRRAVLGCLPLRANMTQGREAIADGCADEILADAKAYFLGRLRELTVNAPR
jgi:hypothetical protein